jgi:hypothetical protein
MRLSELYHELNSIFKDLSIKIKIINFESNSINALTAAYNGIENTINILTFNGKYNIKINKIITNIDSKTIILYRNRDIIEMEIIQNNKNITIKVLYK